MATKSYLSALQFNHVWLEHFFILLITYIHSGMLNALYNTKINCVDQNRIHWYIVDNEDRKRAKKKGLLGSVINSNFSFSFFFFSNDVADLKAK